MINPGSVSAVVAAFRDPLDGQALKSRELILLLLNCSPAPFSRSQFNPGHITCTGLVFAPDGDRLLLVHHKRLDRWLPPGGHVEVDDLDIWNTARREVVEETGAVLLPDAAPRLACVVWCASGEFDRYGLPPNVQRAYARVHRY
jgi:8-oxo-dGTP pyrophosphatase MutT (NUDIX family)